jgi:hypothetical protein
MKLEKETGSIEPEKEPIHLGGGNPLQHQKPSQGLEGSHERPDVRFEQTRARASVQPLRSTF